MYPRYIFFEYPPPTFSCLVDFNGENLIDYNFVASCIICLLKTFLTKIE